MKKFIIMGAILLSSPNSYAGCKINLFVKNVSNQDLIVHNYHSISGIWRDSAVLSKHGVKWRALSRGYWMKDHWLGGEFTLRSEETLGDQYGATFGCKAKRRYRINFSCEGDYNMVFTKYYPSSTGWSKSQNITIEVGNEC